MLASTFLAVGIDAAPTVHTLAPAERAAFDARLALASRRGSDAARLEAYRITFGPGVRWAFPAGPAMLNWLALSYDGPHRDAVRGLAACLATGTPFGPDSGPDSGPSWGDRVPVGPKPAPRSPAGRAPVPAPADALAF